jgi:hypothetical protein
MRRVDPTRNPDRVPNLPRSGSAGRSPAPPTRLLVLLLGVLGAGALASGCGHRPPVRAWQRAHLSKRPMQFNDGLEGRFKQHMYSAREGAEGGYGYVGGGCGCN